MTEFIPGKKLSGLFYQEVVKPLLDRTTPDLKHSAALIGDGSEVLGYDDNVSTDHHWGPRLTLFLTEPDYEKYHIQIYEYLANNLPFEFRGYSTNFSRPDPEDNNNQLLERVSEYPLNHRVEIVTVRRFIQDYLGFDSDNDISPADWLSFPQCKLLGITAAEIYLDQISLQDIIDRFKFYPHDLWLYLMACGWKRIAQEEHLMGRAEQAGDSLGSKIIAGRLARDIMRLAFLMRKRYAPYAKWLGSAFGRLENTGELI